MLTCFPIEAMRHFYVLTENIMNWQKQKGEKIERKHPGYVQNLKMNKSIILPLKELFYLGYILIEITFLFTWTWSLQLSSALMKRKLFRRNLWLNYPHSTLTIMYLIMFILHQYFLLSCAFLNLIALCRKTFLRRMCNWCI